MPAVNYIEQKNYLQTPAYQSIPQRELYTAQQTDIQERPAYQARQQYTLKYQNNERQRDTNENFQFTAPVWAPGRMEQLPATSEQSSSSTWNDYGLPLYSTSSLVKEINKPQLQEPTMKRDDLLQRIRQELEAMNTMNKEKRMEDYLCAA